MTGAMEETDAISGIALEVAGAQGVDTLSASAGRSARYERAAGATVRWERPDASLDPHLEALWVAAREALADTAPLDPRGLPALRFGEARFLCTMGGEVRGIQGALAVLAAHPRLGEVLRRSSAFIRALTARAGPGASVSPGSGRSLL